MKISKIDRLVSVAVIGICLVKAVLYGGSKPSCSGSGVSPVHADTVAQLSGTGVSPVHADAVALPLERARCPFHLSAQSSSQAEDESSAIHHSSFTLLTSWNKRGAYSDWQRIDFPDGFAFPCGTNLLSSVTLMSYGTLRQTLTDITPIAALPAEVSLEPVVSSVIRGLTPSNSYLFAWQNCCVNREATNRVDAVIELFASGDVQVRFGDSVTNIVARPPEDFVGVGQDNDWALAAFPDDYDAITNKGYEAWLMEDKVGINEQNGLYKATITVGNLPDEGPCYLVCGPYKLVVTAPGSYSFPLEVFEHYEARTYPTAVPISVVYDDGYRGEGEMVLPPQNHAPLRLASAPLILPVYFPASFYAWPSQIQLSQAQNAIIALWCNLSISVECVWHSRSSSTLIGFLPPSMAEIRSVFEADDIEFVKRTSKGEARCVVSVIPDHNECCCGSCTGIGCSCGCACHRHESGGSETNGVPSSGTQP